MISPIALDAVKRIAAVFAIERTINGQTTDDRQHVFQESIKPLIDELYDWMTAQRVRISGKGDLATPFDYMLNRWSSFTAFLDVGHICLTNNAAEHMIRPLTLGRRDWTFAGLDRGGERAAAIYTLLQTARLMEFFEDTDKPASAKKSKAYEIRNECETWLRRTKSEEALRRMLRVLKAL